VTDLQAKALFSSALELYRSRGYEDAEAICRQILAGNRRHVDALQLLSQVQIARGYVEEAAATLGKCIRLRPREARYLLLLAGLHQNHGAYRKAVTLYEKALKLAPGDTQAIAGLADVHEKRGDADRARRVLEAHAARMNPGMGRVMATLELHAGNLESALATARKYADDPEATPTVSRHLHFLVAEAEEKLGRYDEAFTAYERANAVVDVRFDYEDYVRKTDVLIEAFSATALPELPRATNTSEVPVFVVGMPRSGSTLVEKIIDAHPAGLGCGENVAMNRLVDALPGATASLKPYPMCMEDLSPADLDARAIHCRRDPLDTCISCFAVRLDPHAHGWASSLDHIGRVHRNYQRLMAHWRQVLDYPVLDVDYEALTGDQEAQSRRIIEFCGLPWDDACLRFHESAKPAETLSYDQVRRPMYRSSVGRAQRFEKHLGPLKAALGE
jgi:tetratricopeptide (TPR) repeat protein